MNVTINKYKLKNQLNEVLKAGQEVTLVFQCGNDEAHVIPFINGQILEYGDLYFGLEELITIELDLPSSGLDWVEGTGWLSFDRDDIFLNYDLEKTECDYTYEPVDPLEELPEGYATTSKLVGSYLLLSKEYDDPIKLSESLAESKKAESRPEKVESKPEYLLTEKEFWSRLRGEEDEQNPPEVEVKRSKPWWRFW